MFFFILSTFTVCIPTQVCTKGTDRQQQHVIQRYKHCVTVHYSHHQANDCHNEYECKYVLDSRVV